MLLVVPCATVSTLRPDSLACRCVPATVEQLASMLTIADEVRVAVPRWQDLPAELVRQLRVLDGSTIDADVANADEILQSLRERIGDLVLRLAAHHRRLLMGVLERDQPDTPARIRVVLAVTDRNASEVDVLGAG